ncbi:unnamed protein product [marine sediment metagenome]|uniref:Helix-hairpin-helix DNA-binding motif class 1 domain-containing protein n=1 Tax=marine sediment metagenome TaxID=412755 RepID=X0WPQ1_9ZZZZ
MNSQAKLCHFLGVARGNTDVETLVAAGYTTPRKIKAATDEQLLALTGIGQAKLAAIRVKCPYSG